nr:hypothetical protein [Cryptomonas sp. NIES-3952]
MFMIRPTNIVLETLLETQLKFKILYSYQDLSEEKSYLSSDLHTWLKKIFLKLIYTLSLKKVLSSKLTNRIIINYFKKFFILSLGNSSFDMEKNKNLIELEYLYTLAINSLYEVSTIKNHD